MHRLVGSDYLCIHNAIYCTLSIHHDVILADITQQILLKKERSEHVD